jgi:hypothetical protein
MSTNMTAREIEKRSEILLRNTPMKSESFNDREVREKAHQQIEPRERQPFMIVFMGMFDYGVVWIGKPGKVDETRDQLQARIDAAEGMLRFWHDQVDAGLVMHPFTSDPHKGDFMIRQQWDLDALTDAIMRSYER